MVRTVDQFSVVSIFIEIASGGDIIASGTAFPVKQDEHAYLITNWHNVTGINPISGEYLSIPYRAPTSFRAWVQQAGTLGTWRPCQFDLLDADGTPVWLEHPILGRRVDVVAVPFRCPDDLQVYPINDLALTDEMAVHVGEDVFILGYPFGLRPTGLFSVWKRGSIATEPELDIERLPKFMVDTASRPGMSGSPVVLRKWGSYQSAHGTHIGTGPRTKFLGIYSGRIGADDELKAQLGIVWRAEVIPVIISSGKRGEM